MPRLPVQLIPIPCPEDKLIERSKAHRSRDSIEVKGNSKLTLLVLPPGSHTKVPLLTLVIAAVKFLASKKLVFKVWFAPGSVYST
jgi:hypothetical protein